MKKILSEVFNQQRMDRCVQVQRKIMQKWQETNSFQYRVVSEKSLEGLTLEELENCYFSVGVGDDLTDLPLIDTLIVFSMISQEHQKLSQRTPALGETEFKIRISVKTQFTEDEVFDLLEGLRIEMPSK